MAGRRVKVLSTGGLLLILMSFLGSAPQAAGSGSNVLPSPSIDFKYTAAGALTRVLDTSQSTDPVATYTYDAVGNMASIARATPASGVTTQGFAPTTGVVGSKVWILGTGFSATPSQDTVKFNGTTASVVDASTTQVVATVPSGATTGTISLTTPSGSATTGSTYTVVSAPAPTISSLSASIAVPPTSVTVSGAHFSTTAADDLVAVNGIRGTPGTVTSSSVAFPVPAYATSGPVTVVTPSGTVSSSADLFVPPLNPNGTGRYAVSDIGFTGRGSVGGGTQTVSLSSSTTVGLLLFSGTQGERVFIEMTHSGISSLQSVYVADPTGRYLTSKAVQSTGFIDTFRLPVSGSYLILSPSGQAGGSCPCTSTYKVVDVPADIADSVTLGTAKSETLAEGRKANLTFAGTASENITVTVNSSALASNGTIRLMDPDGAVVATGGTNVGTSISAAALPSDGQYTVQIDPAGSDSGSISVTVTDPPGHAAQPRPRTTSAPSDDDGDTSAGLYPDSWRSLPGSWDWESHRGDAASTHLAPLRAAAGVTALSGQVVSVGGAPLEGVTLSVGSKRTRSDATGRFLLTGLRSGHTVLDVDSSGVRRRRETFGNYELSATVRRGETTMLSHTIWLTALDTRHEVRLHYPLRRAVAVRSPYIPGLTLRLPAGTEVRDTAGRLVRRIGITPQPLDRTTLPAPGIANFPIAFTIQPSAAAVLPRGASITYPNAAGAAPGTRMPLWRYDADESGWEIYGHGRVTADGKRVVFGKRLRLDELGGVDIDFLGKLFPFGPLDRKQGGDPVNLGSGVFNYSKTDLVEPGPLPIVIGRNYNQSDILATPSQPFRAFGSSMSWSYGMFLTDPGASGNFDEIDLSKPDGGKILFERISTSTNPKDPANPLLLQARSTPGQFYKATLQWSSQDSSWHMTLRDGTLYGFSEGSGYLSFEQDRYGNEVSLGFTGNEATSIVNSAGRWVTVAYNTGTNGHVTSLTDQSGRAVSYSYVSGSSPGELQVVTDLSGHTETFGWDTSGRIHTITDPRSIQYLTIGYDSNDRVHTQTLDDGTGSPPVYTFSYTTTGGAVTETDVIDPNQNQTSGLGQREVEFNADGYSTSDTYAAGTSLARTTTYDRASGSNLVQITTEPLTATTTRTVSYTYDEWGDPVTITTPNSDGSGTLTTQLTYEPQFHQLQSVEDPLSHTTEYDYYADGHLKTATNAVSAVTTFHYNDGGQIAAIDYPVKGTTTFGYALGDLTSSTDALGRTSKMFVDSPGRATIMTDAMGYENDYTYNDASWPTSTTDPSGAETDYSYNAAGLLTRVTDANGNITQYSYDNMERESTHTSSHAPTGSGASDTYAYDKDGNLTSWTDRTGQVNAYTYDALDRRTFIGYNKTAGPTYSSTIDLGYDLGNRLTTLTDSANGTITRTYDRLDALTSDQTPVGTVNYSYDDADRRHTMTIGSAVTTYGYDDANQLTSVTRGALEADVAYDELGRADLVTLPDGITEDLEYDDASDITSISYDDGATHLGNLQYAYNDDGREVAVGGSYARIALPSAVASSSITYNNANRLTKWNGTTFTYDSNGNLTDDGTNTYAYNARNTLTSIKQGSTTIATMGYDALGRRRRLTLNGTATYFLSDGQNPIQEQDSSGTPTLDILAGLDLNQLFATTVPSGGEADLLTDRLGTTVASADGTGTIGTSYTYRPFGKVTAGGSSANRYRFTRQPDDTTGLDYSRARYYNPSWGRFISEDPSGITDPSANLYRYANDDPINNTDVSGHCIATATLGVLIGASYGWYEGGGRKALEWGFTGLVFGCGAGALGDALLGEAALAEGAGDLGLGEGLASEEAATGEATAEGAEGTVEETAGETGETCTANSLAPGTEVKMADGREKPIRAVKVGDRVRSTDPYTGRSANGRVTAVVRHVTMHTLIEITLSDGTRIVATGGHPFWDANVQRFVTAAHLAKGETLQRPGGREISIAAIDRTRRVSIAYNLSVEGLHTFYAGSTPVLVHNCPVRPGGGANDPPSWVKTEGGLPLPGETAQQYATRILNQKYGPGTWPKGAGTEYSKIVKWAQRSGKLS